MTDNKNKRTTLEAIEDLCVEDILGLSDNEIMAEALEEMGGQEAVDKEVERIRKIVRKAITKAKEQSNG